MTAVAAFPNLYFALFKYLCGFDIFKQCTVSFLVVLFYLCHCSEFCGEFRKALLFGSFCKACVHIRPFVIFACGGIGEIFACIAETRKFLEPHFCVLLFVFGCFEEEGGHLFITLFLRNRCEIGVFVSCFGFARKGGAKIFFGLCTCVFVCCHNNTSDNIYTIIYYTTARCRIQIIYFSIFLTSVEV